MAVTLPVFSITNEGACWPPEQALKDCVRLYVGVAQLTVTAVAAV